MYLVAAVVAVAAAAPAEADQQDPRLDALFASLKAATAPSEETEAAERQIWDIWSQHGDEAVADLLSNGTLAMHLREFEEAVEAFSLVVDKAPDFAEGWNKRATVFYLMGRYQDSAADVARTLELEPRHFGALSGLGLINAALGNNEAALKAFRAALEINPHMPGARANAEVLEDMLEDNKI